MTIDQDKLNLILAKKSMAAYELRPGVSSQTIKKITHGQSVTPKTVGRVASILHVDVTDLV